MHAALLTNRGVWMTVSVGYTTCFLRVVVVDYQSTSDAHVTYMPLLEALMFN